MENTKKNLLILVENLLNQKILSPSDLRPYTGGTLDSSDPEFVREDLEDWYRKSGIESVTGRKLKLSPCAFTEEEIREAQRHNEIILCVPGGVTREEFGKLFYVESWALSDPLVTRATEKEDFWFMTSANPTPGYLKKTGLEITQEFEDQKKVHFSLERYLVFIARMRFLSGATPDSEYWIWLPHGRYDRSGMLIAGFDRYGTFNVHGWMPQFSASFLGARYGSLPRNTI